MSYGSSSSSVGDGGGEVFTVLVLGKSGNGKSSVCNALLGEKRFPEGRGMAATTLTAHSETTVRGNMRLKVVDTPDVTNCQMDGQRRREEVSKWRQLTLPRPSAVLLTVRCDVRYTPEEHAIYREMMSLWGDNSLKDRLVVAFTFGDRQDDDLEEELKTVCPELKTVLRDAGNQYVLFDKTKDESRMAITFDVVSAIERRKRAKGSGPFSRSTAPGHYPGDSGSATRSKHGLVSSKAGTIVMVALACILAILTIVFTIIGKTAAAIGCGVVGVIVVIVLIVIVCQNSQTRIC